MSRFRENRRLAIAFAAGVLVAATLATLPAWALSCNNCVDGSDIVDGAVKGADIGNGSVTTNDLKDGTVAAADLKSGAVTTSKFGTIPSARAERSSDQTIATGSVTTLTFDTDRFDTANLHSTTTNTSRMTAPTTGAYMIVANIRWASNATGNRYVNITVNGTPRIAEVWHDANATADTDQTVSTIYKLAAGDYAEVNVYQTSGGNLDINAHEVLPAFSMAWIGPA